MSLATRELSFAARLLARKPGYTLVAVLTLGLALGACTAIYSLVHGVLLQPLPYPNPDQVVQVWQINGSRGQTQFSEPNFDDLRAHATSFQAMAQYGEATTSIMAGTLALRANTAMVSRDFFDVFATRPSRGRTFAADELREGGTAVAIVSDRFWRQHYDHHSELASAVLRGRGQAYTIVGVMPPGFDAPAGVDIWTPREAAPRSPFRTGHNWRVVARVKGGVSLDAARADAAAVARSLKQAHGDGTWMTGVALVPLRDEMVGRVRPVLLLLLAAVGLLLVVACANLANLLVVRVTSRRRELAVRSALGATGGLLMLPLVLESLLLAFAGGAVGIALARAAVWAIARADAANLPRLAEVRLSWPVVAFAAAATLATALVLSAVSAWRARRPDLVEWLKDAQRSQAGRASAGRFRSALVIAQLAVSVVLLIGAGLLGRSLARLLNQDTGFRTEGVLTVEVSLPRPTVRPSPEGLQIDDPSSLARQAQFNTRLIERLRAMPGVVDAGGINRFPMGGGYSNGRFVIVRGDERQTLTDLGRLMNLPERVGEAEFRVASAGYFRTMGIPLVRGRGFSESDTTEARHVALISESLARARWPKSDPIGVQIQFGGMDGDMRVFTIVGIVGDIRERGLSAEPRPTFYADYRQRPLSTFDFAAVLHTSVPPSSLVANARQIVRELNPELPPRFRTIEEVVAASVAGRRFTLALTGVFAGAAVLLAMLGVYGVLSYLVAQRRQEFGVRMALGAQSSDVQRLVLVEAARLVIVGLALGAALALGASRVLERMLFGVSATDPLTYAGVTFGMAMVALLACLVPAIRATRIDPLEALRTG